MFHRFFSNINDKVTWRDDLHLDIMLQFGARQQSNIFVFVSYFFVYFILFVFLILFRYTTICFFSDLFTKKKFFFSFRY